MTPIEIMALIVVIIGILKLIVIMIKPKNWFSVVKVVYAKPFLTIFIALILAGVTLFFLLKQLTIVQIFGVMLFMICLIFMSFALYSKETIAFAKKILNKRNFLKKAWFLILIWLALFVWALYVLFF